MLTDFPIQAILDRLVVRIVDVLPVSAAGVTLVAPGVSLRYVAASDQSALRFEQLQVEIGEGPCLAAARGGVAVLVPDLRADTRFPRFAARALEAGLLAVFTFPLRHGGERLGALDLYRDAPGSLDPGAMTAAQTLADVAAAYLLNAQARDDLREASDRARQSALHDPLTGLPSRTLLVDRLDDAVLRGRRSGKSVAILYVDLDGFKTVNDTYGHHVGDELLVAMAQRMRALLRPGDTLARLSGDEFVVLCEDLDDRAQVEAVAGRVASALAESFRLSGVEVRVSASVGVAFAGRGADIPTQLLRNADSAMYEAKRLGGGRHRVFDLGEDALAERRVALGRDLGGAQGRQELRADYQPIVATADRKVIGAEVLLRWEHPDRGWVKPEVAVPLAERSGLITEIGRWILERACRDRQHWRSNGYQTDLSLAVNVSAVQLMAPDFAAVVAEVLADTGTDPATVTLEVTEGVFVAESERALAVLKALKRVGVRLALDDFGTGYSSLGYLKHFPFDTLKIDREFVAGLGKDVASGVIVDAVVGLAHGLSMTVVAEGVETAQQYYEVLSRGCDASQGFYFASPMSAADLGLMLSTRNEPMGLALPRAGTG
jgi:diguanylate cyclase (GGDEF)-like protein